ncbi:aldo/keto reductase [Oculatella sp. FACHB-28]|uniref:aldo/keto reductase n=1 Tax=Oculatella sp. FACHB-28 TaxID=2692845 RepID=UPI001684A57E|nr:aldo/keto reductase [Oculatella sp. FACHB-28]MBD2056344.1 aldo/keto reductase [Oculatella sp. FACHB-28]
MQTVKLVSGATMPVLGQGTWRMGENGRQRKEEVDALRFGIDLGMTLIDTAEMYGEGGTEEIVGEAIAPNRDQIFLVSKVYPHNATRRGTIAACERSLKRLKTDRLDLYLLHWRGSTPLAETIEAFQELRQAGKIRDFGVSNFDRDDMEEAHSLDQGLTTTNQVLYNLSRRGIEWDLLPWCREQNVAVMAYSPLEQGRMLNNSSLKTIAERHHASAAQVAIAWLLQQGVIVIPKSSNRDRIRENYAALDLKLTDADLTELNQAFPPPQKARPLEVL